MILFNDLQQRYLEHKAELDAAVLRVLSKGHYVMGPELSAFEMEFAGYIGTQYCIGVANGTEAIAISLLACGLQPGDEVITTAMTAFPTITGIMQAQGVPVVVDVNLHDGLIDCTVTKAAITPKTKAIVPVHLYGQCCDMDALRAIANEHGLFIVEDAAQAAGSTYKGKKAGSFGDCNAFSFYPTKNLGCFGDGGAITTNKKELNEKCLMLRNYGQSRRYYHDVPGINSRLDELQAAMLRVNLQYLDLDNTLRAAIAAMYRKQLKTVTCLDEQDYGMSNNHLFVVKHIHRNKILKYLESREIQSIIHYPVPVHKQRAFLGRAAVDLSRSQEFADTIFSLPLYSHLPMKDINRIIEVVNGFSG
jgi:dTDP-4-amino-4,6-dideoxygalactose transaminase